MSRNQENSRRFRNEEEQSGFRRNPHDKQFVGDRRRDDRRRDDRRDFRRDDRRDDRRRDEGRDFRRDDRRDFRKDDRRDDRRRDDRKVKETYYQNSNIYIWKLGEENCIEKCYVSSHQKIVEKDLAKNFQWKEGKIYCENRKPLKIGEEFVYDKFGNQLFEEERTFEEANYKFIPDVESNISNILMSKTPYRFNIDGETYVKPNVGLKEYEGCLFAIFKYNKKSKGFVQIIPPNHFFRISETNDHIEIKKIDSDEEYAKAPTSLISTVKLVEKTFEKQEESISTPEEVEKQKE